MRYEYFLLKQDLYYGTGTQCPLASYYEYSREVQKGDYSGLDNFKVTTVRPGEFNEYPDIISRQVFMVRQKILDAILLFDKSINYGTRYLMDMEYKVMHPYFIPHLQPIDCLSSKAEISHGSLKKAVLSTAKIKEETHIFQIGNLDDNTVVVSTALLEAILRRKPEMIEYSRVEMSEV